MPRYTFDVEGGPSATVELPSLADAKCEAVRYAGRLMCDSADSFWDARDFQMIVSNDEGLALFSLHMIGTDAPSILGSA